MARHQRARRLRFGDDFGRDHPPLSRLSDRRIAGAARPHRDVERSRSRGRARRRQRRQYRDTGQFLGFTLAMGLPSWRYEIDGITLEKSVVMPARHNIVHIDLSLDRRPSAVRLRLRLSLHQFSPLEAPVNEALAANLRADRPGHRLRGHRRPRSAELAHDHGGLRDRDLHRRWRLAARVPVCDRGAARLRGARLGVEPRLFHRRAAAGLPGDADRRDRALAHHAGADPRGRPQFRGRTAPPAGRRWRCRRRASGLPRNSSSPPTLSSSPRSAASPTSRARTPRATMCAP